ncbi:MAG: hypothetical protein E7255_00585 [Lachnospiraceae bacterium]|nr:hypothetical protein [Lachnospiraceae bacterium]
MTMHVVPAVKQKIIESRVIATNRNSRKIYKKLMINYMSVLICIILLLETYFLISIYRETRKKNLEYIDMMCQSGIEYVDDIATKASSVQFSLYQNKMQLQDVIWFLSLDTDEYYNKKFDSFVQDKDNVFQGIRTFVADALTRSSYITDINLISYRFLTKYTYTPDGSMKSTTFHIRHNAMEKNVFVSDGNIVFEKEIRDPHTFASAGCMQVAFSSQGFTRLENRYGKAKIFVYHDDGSIVYESEPGRFENLQQFNSSGEIEKEYDVYIHRQQKKDLNVLAYVDKKETNDISIPVYIMLILVGAMLLICGTFLVNRRLEKLTSRMETIISGMKQAMSGDFGIRLRVGHEDELDIIAEYFNEMCKNLDSYIQKSYIAEIEQKNAEMSALQSQINPHFLYNTLEAIRMKAICNEDKEVGKMLYDLAVIFRSQIKDSNIINLAKEIYYCKKYLEIFEFRYQGNFRFELDCPEKYMLVPVIKFTIQPVIENYFVHGIRLEDDDNRLAVQVTEEDGDLLVFVKDNGKGMTKEQLEEIEEELKAKSTSQGSLGLLNVHRRMTAAYGAEYGVFLEQNMPHGLCVTLKLPMKEDHNV